MTGTPKDSGSKLPLHDEAEAREKWRGGETILKGGGDDLGLPASEVDHTSPSSDQGSDGSDGRPGQGRAGDFPPPD